MSSEIPSFEEAVYLLEEWGFVVESGPQPDEVTLIIEGRDYRTYAVHKSHMLPQIVNVMLRVRLQNIGRWFERVEVTSSVHN
jgi:hypothetical protein